MTHQQIEALAMKNNCTVTWFSCVMVTYKGYNRLIGEAYNVERWSSEKWIKCFENVIRESKGDNAI